MAQALRGARVLITGGGARLGNAIARGLGQRGAEVAIHFLHSEAGAHSLVSELTQAGQRAAKFHADLTDPGAISELVERVEGQFGPLTALVNSAAIFERASFIETSLDSLERHWTLNARAPYLLTQTVVARMQARTGGDVVNILDIGGALVPWRNYSAYCITKAALAMLTRCLALELAPKIRVNAVAPGTVLPPEGLSASQLEQLRRQIPFQRYVSAEEVAEAVAFLLAGPRSMTGQIIAVDGGRSLGGSGA